MLHGVGQGVVHMKKWLSRILRTQWNVIDRSISSSIMDTMSEVFGCFGLFAGVTLTVALFELLQARVEFVRANSRWIIGGFIASFVVANILAQTKSGRIRNVLLVVAMPLMIVAVVPIALALLLWHAFQLLLLTVVLLPLLLIYLVFLGQHKIVALAERLEPSRLLGYIGLALIIGSAAIAIWGQ
jgi:hypothetical protein